MKLDYICERCLAYLEVAGGVKFTTGNAPVCPPKRCTCGHAASLVVDREQHQVDLREPLAQAVRIYVGSDGEATKALYNSLGAIGPAGTIAVELFRAHKSSSRAKVYRGGGYRGMAYDRKEWAMGNVCSLLERHAEACGLVWGWGEDAAQAFHTWVLYVDLPTGQVSFHAEKRGAGPDYPGTWDGVRDAGAGRICRWVAQLLEVKEPVHG